MIPILTEQHHATLLLEELDATTYQSLHRKLLAQPSQRERRQQNNKCKTTARSTITAHFTFESGPMLKFRQELRQLWEKYYIYPGSAMNNVRLQIGTRSNKSLCQLLVKKKPPKQVLTVETSTTNTTMNITTN